MDLNPALFPAYYDALHAMNVAKGNRHRLWMEVLRKSINGQDDGEATARLAEADAEVARLEAEHERLMIAAGTVPHRLG